MKIVWEKFVYFLVKEMTLRSSWALVSNDEVITDLCVVKVHFQRYEEYLYNLVIGVKLPFAFLANRPYELQMPLKFYKN